MVDSREATRREVRTTRRFLERLVNARQFKGCDPVAGRSMLARRSDTVVVIGRPSHDPDTGF